MAEGAFAESTIEATVWLIAHAPERLGEWLDRRGGAALEAIARKRMKRADQMGPI